MRKEEKIMVKKLLLMPLSQECAVILEKSARDLSDDDLKRLKPLSHYNFWLSKAREAAFEANHYYKMLSSSLSLAMYEDIEHCMNAKLQLMDLYYERAMAYKETRKEKRQEKSADPVVLPVNNAAEQSA